MVIDPPSLSFGEQILVLHYLTSVENHDTKEEYVSYKNLPSASFYNPTFRKRSTNRILSAFVDNPEALLDVSKALGAERAELGDVSVRLQVFPKIVVVVLLYRGDEEFPPETELLFRDDIINFLSLEDIAVLSVFVASRLIKVLKRKD